MILHRGQETAYSGLDQSRPVGHNKVPVRSWWKPWSTFTLHAKGGTRLCPLRVIQSRMAPLRLLVSSPLAPDVPLESLSTAISIEWSQWVNNEENHQFSYGINLFFRTFHQAFFHTRNQFQKLLEDTVFSPLPGKRASSASLFVMLVQMCPTLQWSSPLEHQLIHPFVTAHC